MFDTEIAQIVGLSIGTLRRIIERSSTIQTRQHPGGRIAYDLAAVRHFVARNSKNINDMQGKSI